MLAIQGVNMSKCENLYDTYLFPTSGWVVQKLIGHANLIETLIFAIKIVSNSSRKIIGHFYPKTIIRSLRSIDKEKMVDKWPALYLCQKILWKKREAFACQATCHMVRLKKNPTWGWF